MRRLVLLAGIWGWSFLFIKVAVKGMPPVAVACGRCLLGSTVLLVVLRSRFDFVNQRHRLLKQDPPVLERTLVYVKHVVDFRIDGVF